MVIKEGDVVDANGTKAGLTPGLVHVKFAKETTDEVEVFGKPTTELRFFPHFVLASTEYKDERRKSIWTASFPPPWRRSRPASFPAGPM